MPLSTLLNRPMTLLLRDPSGATDDYGDDIATTTEVDTVGEIQRKVRENEEPGSLGETSDTLWTVFLLPVDEQIRTGDAVRVDGAIYEFVGDPWRVRNPRTGAETHIEITARRIAGSEDAS